MVLARPWTWQQTLMRAPLCNCSPACACRTGPPVQAGSPSGCVPGSFYNGSPLEIPPAHMTAELHL